MILKTKHGYVRFIFVYLFNCLFMMFFGDVCVNGILGFSRLFMIFVYVF